MTFAQELGLKWNVIKERVPGRTAHAIRNRFHRLKELQKQLAAANAPSQEQQAGPQPPPAEAGAGAGSWTWQDLGGGAP